ncbi:MAG: M24 family metallopeptidase [Thermoleophilia bacterium]
MTVPWSEIEHRLAQTQAALVQRDIDCAIIVQSTDLFYLTGTAQQSHLLVPAVGEPLLLVRRDPVRARAESALARVESFTSLRDLPDSLARLGVPATARLGLELDVLPVMNFRRYEQLFPEAELVDCGTALRELRAVKSPWEVEQLRHAGGRAAAAFEAAAAALAPGVTEAELASVVVSTLLRDGHPGLLRMRGMNQELPLVHILAGPHAGVASGSDTPFAGHGRTAAIPQGASDRPIRRGEAVVMDVCASVGGYIVDQTRTLSIGPLPEDLLSAYETCRSIRHEITSAALPGVACAEVYELAVRQAIEAGYETTFMGTAPMQVSFVGHGVGLEVDEFPILGRGWTAPLAAGNVIAVEPKIRVPGRGAVGIEDTCLVTADGLEALTTGDDGVWEV